MNKIKDNIKNLRTKIGLSQEELARRSGIKLSNLSKIEAGFNSNPTLTTLIALAKVLSSGSLDKLLTLKNKKRH
jgi:transcriptional regulator with XRE-family HTH domain